MNKRLLFLFLLTATIGLGLRAAAPEGLLVNLLPRPEKCVITTPQPSFCWIPSGERQTAYEIELQQLSSQGTQRWVSGRISSPQSLHVPYQGSQLSPNTTYRWRVKTWDNRDTESDFSGWQTFHTGEFHHQRSWPGESRWTKLVNGGDTLWTFEDREPISYHSYFPVKTLLCPGNRWFIDFRQAGFANARLTLKWDPADPATDTATVTIHIGEKAVGDSIDRKPGGGIIFRSYPLTLRRGTHDYTINLPRFVPKYPHSQPMPSFMPEVIPFRFCEILCGEQPVSVVRAEQLRLFCEFDGSMSSFSSANKLLNDIYALCRYSTIANTFNGDYASSERERMLYEADTYIQQLAHYAVDREYCIARYSLVNMIFHATWPTEWISHAILMAWADYENTGDPSLLVKYYDDLKPKTLMGLKEKNGLISTLTGLQTDEFKRSIHFKGGRLSDIVDWPHGGPWSVRKGGETDDYDLAQPNAKPQDIPPTSIYNTVVNAFHYRSLVLMSRIAAVVGHRADEKFYAAEAARVKKAINTLLFDRKKGIYADGLGSSHYSLHASMFPLAFGVVEKENMATVRDFIRSKGMACGVYGANYLLEALFDNGEAEHGYSLLTANDERSWSNMLRLGATMTTEAWDNKYKVNNGWSHAWSASPAHIIPRKIMGIEPGEPGFGKIIIAPRLCGLKQAEATMPTIRGEIRASMKYDDASFCYRFTTPPNTTATFVVPDRYAAGNIQLDGRTVKPRKQKNGTWTLESLAPGTHTVSIGK